MPAPSIIEKRELKPLAEGKNLTTLRLAVGIATVGRPEIVAEMLKRLRRQTRHADAIFICSPSEADVAGIADSYPEVKLLEGPRGSSHQRNVILDHSRNFDAVVFFDDDYIPSANFLENADAFLRVHEDVVVVTGNVLADGILGPGLSFGEADSIISKDNSDQASLAEMTDVYNAYGCNMVVRLKPVHTNGIVFDENLPLYAWQEDADFSRQLANFGRIVRTPACRGVHLGVKSGRQSGVRLGYSQIANPIYLARKGTMLWKRSLFLMSRNFAANCIKSFRNEPWVDRRGRLIGNLRAIGDLMTGRLDPGRVVSM